MYLPQGLAKSRTGDVAQNSKALQTERSRIFSRALHADGINDGTSGVTGARRVPSDEAADAETPCKIQTDIEIENDIEANMCIQKLSD